jgi:NMD protein affecting ribosome stability and mRNA decay
MSVQIQVKCIKCGEDYDPRAFSFCPKCSCIETVDLRSPTQQIQDTSSGTEIGKNHCQ